MKNDISAVVGDISNLRAAVAIRGSFGILDEYRRTRFALLLGSSVDLIGYHANLIVLQGVDPLPEQSWNRALALAQRAVDENSFDPLLEIDLPAFNMIASGVNAGRANSWHQDRSLVLDDPDFFGPEERLQALRGELALIQKFRDACPPAERIIAAAEELEFAADKGVLKIHDWGWMLGATPRSLNSSYEKLAGELGRISPFEVIDDAGAALMKPVTSHANVRRERLAEALGTRFIRNRVDLGGLSIPTVIEWRELLARDLTRFRLRLLELANDSPDDFDDSKLEAWLEKSVTKLDIELGRLMVGIEEAKRRFRRRATTALGASLIPSPGMLGLVKSGVGFFASREARLDGLRENPLYFVYRLSRGA
ncbi:hypothetical protein ACIA5D_27025 [Actinoplanes sp. NPDC051513]|uniref:hypothetical protein n=1 Tax=Actinoplanes sp. NPDC051513 TaxID=3363908 RepID=UPI0037990766